MSSISGCKRQGLECWPGEIRLLMLKALIQDGCKLAPLATVSREWQAELERHNFARFKLTPSQPGPLGISDTHKCPITASFQTQFSILGTWDPKSDLTFLSDTPSPSQQYRPDLKSCDDAQHGWVAGSRHAAPPHKASLKIFNAIMEEGPFDSNHLECEWWDQLPSVPAVTGMLLRQQNRRRWKPGALAHMLARPPRLQGVHHKPWREWDEIQRWTDKDLARCDRASNPDPAVSRMIALASLRLEHLAASFLVDARRFFSIEPSWEWPNPTSIVLTSKMLRPGEDPVKSGAMLQAAAAAALRMPRLETMEIWNGRKWLAAIFRYQTLLAAIKSHGDAIPCLGLLGQVIRPVSLQQIQIELKALEAAETSLLSFR
ncbi:hypothetical protein B0H67DRAFT_634640 [Lasiosphaeris hirsuta]|uniref:DUF6546 domain-containing protein n=1 Tax=Lasiosphaeris hirsuta TaxID=260670 RepID=A0AA40AG78_9PEZI|nr:hypothetical protein B0H67DRAFT_634640 [Lasiosphaeris hirsuta]